MNKLMLELVTVKMVNTHQTLKTVRELISLTKFIKLKRVTFSRINYHPQYLEKRRY